VKCVRRTGVQDGAGVVTNDLKGKSVGVHDVDCITSTDGGTRGRQLNVDHASRYFVAWPSSVVRDHLKPRKQPTNFYVDLYSVPLLHIRMYDTFVNDDQHQDQHQFRLNLPFLIIGAYTSLGNQSINQSINQVYFRQKSIATTK